MRCVRRRTQVALVEVERVWLEGNNGHWQEQLKAGSVDLVRIF